MSLYLKNSNVVGLFQTNKSQSSGLFSGFSLSDYTSIKSGSYRKLLNTYYGGSDSTNSTTSNAVSKIVESQTGKNLTSVKSNSDELSDAAKALYSSGSDSVFTMKEVSSKDAITGEVTKSKQYDRDAISKAVNTFVSEYNDVIEAVDNTDSSRVLKTGINMAKQTGAYIRSLAEVGITINYDNSLSVDETKLAAAKISDLKTLFNGVGSFAYQTSQKADQLGLAAKQSSSASTLYGSNGSYNYFDYFSSINSYL